MSTATPESTNTDTAVKTVDSIETDQHILIARTQQFIRDHGYRAYAENLLSGVGLAHLLPPTGPQFTVDISAFATELAAEPATITTQPGQEAPNSFAVASLVHDWIEVKLGRFITTIQNEEITAQPITNTPTVDIDAITAEWGDYTTPYPAAGTAQIEDFRHTTVRAALQSAIEHRYCPDVETYLGRIGLTAYLPPKTKRITIPIPGYGTTEATTVTLTRLGDIRPEDVRRIAIDHLIADWDRHGDLPYQDATA